MTPFEKAILGATAKAAEVTARLPVVMPRTSFDIVGAVTAHNIPLLFRPLKNLWGASVTIENDHGIIVTSKMDLHFQRFTLAHELGHTLLEHREKFDSDIANIDFAGKFGHNHTHLDEKAANTFASEVLGQLSLIRNIANRQHWSKNMLKDSTKVYQLSLRLGMSFLATCWSLYNHEIIDQPLARALTATKVLDLKHSLVPASSLSDSWNNVWSLTKADSGTLIEASVDDVFAIKLEDNTCAGYLWELIETEHVKVIDEVFADFEGEETYGNTSVKTLLIRFEGPGTHRLSFLHRRPWNQEETIDEIELHIDNFGKEQAGLPRRVLEESLAA